MKVEKIFYSDVFASQFGGLPMAIQKKAVKAEGLFSSNPFHPSLRLHKLKGKLKGAWSISLDRKYRIIFTPQEDGEVLFVSIGLHAIYEKK